MGETGIALRGLFRVIRRIFERGVGFCGTDYLAHSLWNKYITFEGNNGTVTTLARVYSQVLACPIKELDKFYSRYHLIHRFVLSVGRLLRLKLLSNALKLRFDVRYLTYVLFVISKSTNA